MPRKQWEIHVHGVQRAEIDTDLMAQIVVMLGRQLQQETMTDDAESVAGDTSEADEAEAG